jgi:hypothetical protein
MPLPAVHGRVGRLRRDAEAGEAVILVVLLCVLAVAAGLWLGAVIARVLEGIERNST